VDMLMRDQVVNGGNNRPVMMPCSSIIL
jgi:hypothetical protein